MRIFLIALFVTASCFAADTPSVTPPDEVRADTFGFDDQDATQALQAAINSGAKKVIVGDLGKPWIVTPIKLRSDLELIFEKGAVVQAKRGEFQRAGDSLFSALGAHNIVIRGEGNVLRMWKSDYQNPPYTKSEWRNSLTFRGCSDVEVSGLVLEESGGDGIYVGSYKEKSCERMTIRNIQSLRHHRQGISVISAKDLLIEHCVFNDTDGTAPMAGIDFEPNDPTEQLVNCVVKHCVFEKNSHAGVLFALGRLDATSEPMSVTLEDCVIRGNGAAMRIVPRNPNGVRGNIEFRRCVFADSPKAGITIERKSLAAARVIFDNCRFSNLATDQKDAAPLGILGRSVQGDPVGGVEFHDCTVEDPLERRPLSYDDLNGMRLTDVTGTLHVKHGETTETLHLTQELLDQWFPWSADLRDYPRISLEGVTLVPMEKNASPPFAAFPGWLRGHSVFATSVATAGDVIQFQITSRLIGKPTEIPPIVVEIVSPSGKSETLESAIVGKPADYRYTSTESGTHHIRINGGSHAIACSSGTNPVNAISLTRGFHLIGASGAIAIPVPAGTKAFSIRVSGAGGSERVHAIVRDPSGRIAGDVDNIETPGHQFLLKNDDVSKAVAWTIELARPSEGVIEDIYLMLDGLPPILAPDAHSLLLPEK